MRVLGKEKRSKLCANTSGWFDRYGKKAIKFDFSAILRKSCYSCITFISRRNFNGVLWRISILCDSSAMYSFFYQYDIKSITRCLLYSTELLVFSTFKKKNQYDIPSTYPLGYFKTVTYEVGLIYFVTSSYAIVTNIWMWNFWNEVKKVFISQVTQELCRLQTICHCEFPKKWILFFFSDISLKQIHCEFGKTFRLVCCQTISRRLT